MDSHRIHKSFKISDEPMSQDTFNTTNVHQRISIHKITKLDRVNTYDNLTRLEDHQGKNQRDLTNTLQL